MSAPAPEAVRAACEALAARNAALARAYGEIGVPDWRRTDCSFEGLARMLAFQQVSTKAGAAIWSRVAALADPMRAEAILALDENALRAAGLSWAKVRYIRAIAECEQAGTLCFETLGSAPRAVARAQLVSVKGIGPWTAEVFLLTATGCLDAWPPGDVGLMEAYRLLSDAPDRHAPKAFCALAEDWAPWRGVATLLLWGWINAERARETAPVA